MAEKSLLPTAENQRLIRPAPYVASKQSFIPFNQVAKDFDPYMPAQQYNNIQEQYFWSIVSPRLPTNLSRTDALGEFKRQTARPSMLTGGEKALVQIGLLATGHVKSLVEVASLVPQVKPLLEKLEQQQRDLTELALREGMPVAPATLLGEFSGMLLPFVTLEKLIGPVAALALSRAKLSAKVFSFANRATRGSLAFGTYEALSETHGDRLVAGAHGLALGAVFEFGLAGAVGGAVWLGKTSERVFNPMLEKAYTLGLDTVSYLKAKGVKNAEKVVQNAMHGKPIPPEADIALSQKMTHDALTQKEKSFIFEAVEKEEMGFSAEQVLRNAEGVEKRILIAPGREIEAFQKAQDLVSQGWERGPVEYATGQYSLVNRYLSLAKTEAEIPANHYVLSVAKGQEEAVAKRMKGSVVGSGKVAAPKLDRDLGAMPEEAEINRFVDEYYSDIAGTEAAAKAPLVKSLIKELWREDLSPGMKQTLIGRIRQSGGGFVSQTDEIATGFEELLPVKYRTKTVDDWVEIAKNEWLGTHEAVTPSILKMQLGVPDTLAYDVFLGLEKANLIDDVGRRIGGEVAISTKLSEEALPSLNLPEFMNVAQAKELRKLGYEPRDLLKMEKSQMEDILFEEIPKRVGTAEKPWTLESLRQTAKEYDFDPELITEAQVSMANQVGKDRVIEILGKSQLEEVKGAAEALPATSKSTKVEQASLFEEQMRLAGDEKTRFVVQRHTPEVELSPVEGEAIIRKRPRATYGIIPTGTPGFEGIAGETIAREGRPTVILDAGQLTDPGLRRQLLYHENMHIDLLPMPRAFETPAIEKGVLEAGEQIAAGLGSKYAKHYKGVAKSQLLEEAYVHASSALRTGDQEYLAMLAGWNKDLPHVLKWIKEMSGSLKGSLAGMEDSLYKRSLQRKVDDLIRRSDDSTLQHLREFVDEFGVPDLVNGQFVYRQAGKERILGSLRSVHDYIDTNDLSSQAVSFTSRLEALGVRGPSFMPARSRGPSTNGGAPLPEIVPVKKGPFDASELNTAAISWLYKPFMNWAAKAQESINKALIKRGKVANIDIYNPIKQIDDAVLDKTRLGDQIAEKLQKELTGLGDAKNYDITMWLSHAPSDRPEIAAKLKMTLDEVGRAERLEKVIREDIDPLLPGTARYLTGTEELPSTLKTLRVFEYAPEAIWGKAGGQSEAKSAGFFERAIRKDPGYEGTLDPKDEHLGRILHYLTNEGLNHKYLKQPLDQLKKIMDIKTPEGDFVLGAARMPVTNYVRYLEGRPDISQQIMNNLVRTVEGTIAKNAKQINKYLPDFAKIDETELVFPQQTINKMLMLQYSAGLGMRPIVYVRDSFQSFLSLPVVGPKNYFKGMQKAMTSEGWAQASREGALLGKMSVGQLWGDLSRELATGGAKTSDWIMTAAKKLMAVHRHSNNLGRAGTYLMEYPRALKAVNNYRSGKWSIADLKDPKKTALWFYDPPAQSRLLNMADLKTEAVEVGSLNRLGRPYTNEEVARRMALELVDLTQWPYRAGTQPSLMMTGAGRVFGMYGQWPLNYLDYMKRLTRKTFLPVDSSTRAAGIKAGALWLLYNGAITESASSLGTDMDRWFWISGAGYAGSPSFQMVQDLWAAAEDSPEGRRARGDLLRSPVNFIPGSVAMRQWIKAMEKDEYWNTGKGRPGESFWRLMGAKPVDELERDRDISEWLAEESGYKRGSVYR